MKVFREPIEFDWDKGNIDKNLKRHGVRNEECEEIFFDSAKRALRDPLHSGREKRYIIIGKTKRQRVLFLVFTTRGKKIRVISARDLNTKELHLYHEKKS